MRQPRAASQRLALALLSLFTLDRLAKMAAIIHFFRKTPPPQPARWPSVTLLQPVSRGASDLRAALWARAHLSYPARVQHLLVCDVGDELSQVACRAFLEAFPGVWGEIILVEKGTGRAMATKTEKLLAGLPHVEGEVVCCVDDDVILRPDALRVLVPYLFEPNAGAAFGLACYASWRNLPTGLMSVFVNANALLSYIPLLYLAEPFTITGHCYALKATTLHAAGGFKAMEGRVDDDHDLAQRLRRMGLHSVQTPMVYDVVNHFDSLRAYAAQMKRWFVFPRQALLPIMTPREQTISLLGSIGNLVPGILSLIALLTHRRAPLYICLGIFAACYALCERLYLKRRTPARWWPLVPITALLSPLQIIWSLLSSDEIEWRGQTMRVSKGGHFEIVGTANRQEA